jgi:hypothetical protein
MATTAQLINAEYIDAICEHPIADGDLSHSNAFPSPINTYTNTNTIIPPGTPDPYLELITSEHQESPKYLEIVKLLTEGFWDNTILLDNFYTYFDINTAIGNQLDILGQWIGISRNVRSPISGAFFSFDIIGLGFDESFWDQALGMGNSQLSDTDYRVILQAKIMLNTWDGTLAQATANLSVMLPNNIIYVRDNQNMTMTYFVSGKLSIVTRALLKQGYFDLRPAGVSLTYQETTSGSFFAWGANSGNLRGWGTGSWATPLI